MIRSRLFYALVHVFVFGVGWLPRPVSTAVCRAIAFVVYLFDRKHRRTGLINLTIAFPEKHRGWRRRILRRSFLQLGDHAVEVCRLACRRLADIPARIAYETGREGYWEVKEQDRPVIFVTAHISAWELLPVAHALLSRPLHFVVRPLDNPLLDRWARRMRSQAGNCVVDKHRSARRILKVLSRGDDVGLLIDQNVQEKEGVYVPFFGREASTTTSAALLAARSNAAVIAGFIVPSSRPGRYRIRFSPPLTLQRTDNRDADVAANTALFNRIIEETVREFPASWLWGHRRFQTQRDGRSPYNV